MSTKNLKPSKKRESSQPMSCTNAKVLLKKKRTKVRSHSAPLPGNNQESLSNISALTRKFNNDLSKPASLKYKSFWCIIIAITSLSIMYLAVIFILNTKNEKKK